MSPTLSKSIVTILNYNNLGDLTQVIWAPTHA